MNIKKIAEGKFLLIIKKLGIEMEFENDREAFQTGLELIGMKQEEIMKVTIKIANISKEEKERNKSMLIKYLESK